MRTRFWGSTGERLLQEATGSTTRARRFYDGQVLDHLNRRMREFIAYQEMLFVATADSLGECDCTFRAGPPGFVHVLDDHRLAWPEYRGNGVLASLGNLTENPHVGLFFVDFFQNTVGLHVNGRADILDELPGVPVDPVPGRRAERWVVVRVEEAYIHCRKHIPRLQKRSEGRRDWGSDDPRSKGGDFFGVAAERDGR
ncbi:pyridoxamine 5'-phosphate oxidase family protein [Hamadaea tsunoensis]|uniref:pyridoxamine 5'-phosphate oxidase family protein n=1 Tax=Hamadaea tsunoensis TaxID=53368 RepID=UPI0003F5E182|nr:pyridoxamine 5'-phosphate oxidase family protein [Hamadaea tsunoensis]